MQYLEAELLECEDCPGASEGPLAELESGKDLVNSFRVFDISKRIADVFCSGLALFLGFPFLILIALLISWTSPGPAIFWSLRYGKYNVPFKMPKFRTMYVTAPEVPTLALESPETHVTPIGNFLRKTSLDELPQLWSVLTGEMSLIGPRPVICAELDLAEMRASMNVDQLTPGLTGWAQINGRDSVTNEEKVLLDRHYLEQRSVQMDIRIVCETISLVLSREGIVH